MIDEKHVVVKQHKLFGQALKPVNAHLDGSGIECGERGRRHVFLVGDKLQLRMLCIQPWRRLPTGHKEHLIHPWRKLFHPPEPIAHETPVPITVDANSVCAAC